MSVVDMLLPTLYCACNIFVDKLHTQLENHVNFHYLYKHTILHYRNYFSPNIERPSNFHKFSCIYQCEQTKQMFIRRVILEK